MAYFSDNTQLDDLVDCIPQNNLTVKALQTLDFVAPGQWQNFGNFDQMVREVTGSTDEVHLAQVHNRALALFADGENGYQSAFNVFQRVDDFDKILGAAALGDKLTSKIEMLSFMDKLTPPADIIQSIDLAVKVVSELLAYVRLNGVPRSVDDFTGALDNYGSAAKMRLAALVAFDGIIPLGPDFIDKANDRVAKLDQPGLEENKTFQRIKEFLPENIRSVDFVELVFKAVSGNLADMVAKTGMNRDLVVNKLQGFVEVSDDNLDYLGAFLDLTTNYFEHTGLQTVAARAIEQASSEV